MSYPEHGATYRNKPAWMDRAVAGEKRAQGGSASEPKPPLTPDSNQFNPDSPTGRFTDRSPRRADGGRMEPLIDEKGNPNPDNYWDHLVEPSSHHAAQDAREQAAKRTRNTRAMPNSFPVGGEPKQDDDRAEAAPMLDKEAQQKMGRGLGQSIGFRRGGRT